MPFLSYPEQFGFDKGRNEGKSEGRLKGIELGLDLRFGAAGLALLPEVQKRKDEAFLQRFLQRLRCTTTSLEDLKTLLAESDKAHG
jgi:predicted transposase YdaD